MCINGSNKASLGARIRALISGTLCPIRCHSLLLPVSVVIVDQILRPEATGGDHWACDIGVTWRPGMTAEKGGTENLLVRGKTADEHFKVETTFTA